MFSDVSIEIAEYLITGIHPPVFGGGEEITARALCATAHKTARVSPEVPSAEVEALRSPRSHTRRAIARA